MPNWTEVSERNARSVQTTIGWIFWDPGAVSRFQELGLEGPLGYIASRCAPFAGAGPHAVAAAFGSISPVGIAIVFDRLASPEAFWPFWHARNEAVLDGLDAHAPAMAGLLEEFGPELWAVVDQLPTAGRPFAASHLGLERPTHPVLSGWHAVNYLREWRGDTHWALVAAAGLSGDEASILHNAWLQYEPDWLARSRGAAPDAIDAAWGSLAAKGLATQRSVTPQGLDLRESLERRTNETTSVVWQLLGAERSQAFAEQFEPPCEALLRRVDQTAGPNYQPASRIH